MGLCKDGYWREWKSYEGKQYCGIAKFDGDDEKARKAALLELGHKLNDAKNGAVVLDRNMTVKAWSENYLSVYVKPRVREPGQSKSKHTMTQKSYEMYTQKLDGYILPVIGRLHMKDVRDTHLRKILNGEAGKSKSHVSKIRIVIQAMFRQAYASRIITYDPSVGLELPVVTEGKRRSLTEAERTLLIQAADIHRCGLWIETLLGTGIRPGESAPLLIKDFDFDKGLLNIDKDIESGTYSISDPKTKAGMRKIPIPPELIPKLKAAFTGKGPFDIAFPQTDGKTMKSQECISNDWRSFLRTMDILGGARTILIRRSTRGGKNVVTREIRTVAEHGYKAAACGRIMTMDDDKENGSVLADDLVLYCLRHTFCTDLQKDGVPVDIAKYLMGHADIRTTANIYAHPGDETALIAAAILGKKRTEKEAGEKLDATTATTK